MKINSAVQSPEGTVKFEGEVTQQEADLIIEAGLSTLLRAGLFASIFKYGDEELSTDGPEEGDTVQ